MEERLHKLEAEIASYLSQIVSYEDKLSKATAQVEMLTSSIASVREILEPLQARLAIMLGG